MPETPKRQPQGVEYTSAELEQSLAEIQEREAAWPFTNFPSRLYGGVHVDTESGRFVHHGLVPGWIVDGEVRMGSGDLALTHLAVRPAEPVDGDDSAAPDARITSKLLRSIPVAVLLNQVRKALLLSDSARRSAYADRLPERPPLEIGERSGGRRRLDDRRKQVLLRRVAIAYLDEMGEPGVYARLAKRFRRSQDAIKALVRAARTDGWLTGAAHGARGAEPGPRLLRDEKFAQEGKG
ncbi:MAG: hypothetical protein AUI14_05740 [Actinobacteria bacterium 13_2_20CM_2_71_6]|nr:MAG: hypothetical protein AUI14_05740 [Actinobacteria bacterium 13_2_20CM_2_71_6]